MYDKHLDIFHIVADAGSFSKASELLYIAPNAVMKQINSLENSLGFKLFIRTNKGLTLTEAGKSIYIDSHKLIKQSNEAKARAKALLEEDETIVRIGSSVLKSSSYLAPILTKVKKSYPHINIHIIPFRDNIKEKEIVIRSLGEGIDIISGFYNIDKADESYRCFKISDSAICCAVSLNNRLSSKEIITYEDLYGEKLFMVERGDSQSIDMIRDYIEANHPQINIASVPAYDVNTFNYCEKENGIMITAEAWENVHPMLKTIHTDWGFSIPFGLMYPLKPSKAVLEFLDALGDVLKQ